MSQLSDIHEAFVKQLREGIGRDDFNYLAYRDPSIHTNKIEVWPDEDGYVNYYGRGGPDDDADVVVRLRIFTATGGRITAGELMCDMLSLGSQSSVVAAIEADPTLGGVVERCVQVGDVELVLDDDTFAEVAWIRFKITLPC